MSTSKRTSRAFSLAAKCCPTPSVAIVAVAPASARARAIVTAPTIPTIAHAPIARIVVARAVIIATSSMGVGANIGARSPASSSPRARSTSTSTPRARVRALARSSASSIARLVAFEPSIASPRGATSGRPRTENGVQDRCGVASTRIDRIVASSSSPWARARAYARARRTCRRTSSPTRRCALGRARVAPRRRRIESDVARDDGCVVANE